MRSRTSRGVLGFVHAFDFEVDTIRGWIRRCPQADLGVNDVDADLIESRTRKAGQRYRLEGGGHRAIYLRGRKG